MEEYNVFKLICKKTSEIRTIKSFQTRSLWLFLSPPIWSFPAFSVFRQTGAREVMASDGRGE